MMNPSHSLKTAAVSPGILPYAMGLDILLKFILRRMKCSKKNWREVLQVLRVRRETTLRAKEIRMHMEEKGLQVAEVAVTWLARAAGIPVRGMFTFFYLLVCFCSSPQKNYMVLHSHSFECSRGTEWYSKRWPGTPRWYECVLVLRVWTIVYFRNNKLDGTAAAAAISTCQKGVMLNAPSRDACLWINVLS